MVMDKVRAEALPDELRSRVMAATAHASHRHIRRLESGDEAGAAYAVEAVSGDRVTLMRVSLRHDGSVDETTDTFTARDVADLDMDASQITVQGPEGLRTVTVARDTAEAVDAIGG